MKYLKSCSVLAIGLATVLFAHNPCFSSEEKDTVEARMSEMHLVLPKVSAPVANYVPYVIQDNLIFISGQLPMEDGKLKFAGKLGAGLSDEEGAKAARLCALNILAQIKEALGSLDKVKRCIKLSGFVNSTDSFKSHPKIINGASDLMVGVFGDKGKHARAAVGVPSLPLGAAVEIEAIFEIES